MLNRHFSELNDAFLVGAGLARFRNCFGRFYGGSALLALLPKGDFGLGFFGRLQRLSLGMTWAAAIALSRLPVAALPSAISRMVWLQLLIFFWASS